ncbi:MAG: PEGA domain-containing protein [Myxococcales bacterium]|nr:PEGA domain-containing protein [Myxococcales bacterium]
MMGRAKGDQKTANTKYMLLFLMWCFLLLKVPSASAQIPMSIFVWPKSEKDTEAGTQMETLAHHAAKTIANAYPVRFVARRDSNSEPLLAAITKAQELLRMDKTGRRAPELLELATTAYQLGRNELESISLTDLAEIFRLMGIASYLTGQKQLAGDYATAYFHMFSGGTDLEWAEFPETQALALSVQTELKTRAPGSLKLETIPSGAVVELDGKGRGVTPLTVDVPPGLHYVRFSADGYYSKAWIAEAKTQETSSLKLTLQSHPSRTRYEAAMNLIRKSILDEKAAVDIVGACRDVFELVQSKAVLAIVVESREDRYYLQGVFVEKSGKLTRLNKVLVKDATVLTEFAALIASVMADMVDGTTR